MKNFYNAHFQSIEKIYQDKFNIGKLSCLDGTIIESKVINNQLNVVCANEGNPDYDVAIDIPMVNGMFPYLELLYAIYNPNLTYTDIYEYVGRMETYLKEKERKNEKRVKNYSYFPDKIDRVYEDVPYTRFYEFIRNFYDTQISHKMDDPLINKFTPYFKSLVEQYMTIDMMLFEERHITHKCYEGTSRYYYLNIPPYWGSYSSIYGTNVPAIALIKSCFDDNESYHAYIPLCLTSDMTDFIQFIKKRIAAFKEGEVRIEIVFNDIMTAYNSHYTLTDTLPRSLDIPLGETM